MNVLTILFRIRYGGVLSSVSWMLNTTYSPHSVLASFLYQGTSEKCVQLQALKGLYYLFRLIWYSRSLVMNLLSASQIVSGHKCISFYFTQKRNRKVIIIIIKFYLMLFNLWLLQNLLTCKFTNVRFDVSFTISRPYICLFVRVIYSRMVKTKLKVKSWECVSGI